MSLRPVYQMRPHEILAAREASSCAFIPVSPCYEWHSLHLPMGTDALIAEGICRHMAERVHGIYFPPLSFGLDEYRPEHQLTAWGFAKTDRVFGMRFPELPLSSEYCTPEEMKRTIGNRLAAVRDSGFRFSLLVNNHGGTGQTDLLAQIAQEWDRPASRVLAVNTYRFLTYQHEFLKLGGHAGQSETVLLMAFYPELVDFTQLPEGELSVRGVGILHHKPVIEAESNPRHVTLSVANEVRKRILDGFSRFLETTCEVKSVTT
jgi:creatinine amidohydrolase/Fe(II)-dependent formamide hydrolase-like protein